MLHVLCSSYINNNIILMIIHNHEVMCFQIEFICA